LCRLLKIAHSFSEEVFRLGWKDKVRVNTWTEVRVRLVRRMMTGHMLISFFESKKESIVSLFLESVNGFPH